MLLANGPDQYKVGLLVAKAIDSGFYICSDGKNQLFLQIASCVEQNARLDYAAYVLKELKRVSDLYEKRFQSLHPGEQLNYDWLFPTVVDSFTPEGQGNRLANIYAISNGSTLEELVPLSNIRRRDGKVIDLASSVWIAGRLLKLLILAHDQSVSLMIDSDNVIIDPKKHHVVVLDWMNAKMYDDEIPASIREKDIKCVATLTLIALGESFDNPKYPNNVYVDFLKSLAKNPRSDTEQVYREFEAAHGQLFEKTVFYPFATSPI